MVNLSTTNWKLENVKCVLFDKDGTLMDSHIYWSRIIERRSLALISAYELSFDRHEELCSTMGLDLKTKKLQPKGPIALVSRDKVVDVIVGYMNRQSIKIKHVDVSNIFDKEHSLFNKELNQYIQLIPNTLKFVETLKQLGVKTAIVTSDTILNTNTFLDQWEINNLFDFVVGKESTVESKDTGIPAQYAMDKLNVSPENTIAIGDAPIDILMAVKAKMLGGIGVATGQLPIETLRVYTPFTCNTLSEIKIG